MQSSLVAGWARTFRQHHLNHLRGRLNAPTPGGDGSTFSLGCSPQAFQRAVEGCQDGDCRRALRAMCDLFALGIIFHVGEAQPAMVLPCLANRYAHKRCAACYMCAMCDMLVFHVDYIQYIQNYTMGERALRTLLPALCAVIRTAHRAIHMRHTLIHLQNPGPPLPQRGVHRPLQGQSHPRSGGGAVLGTEGWVI